MLSGQGEADNYYRPSIAYLYALEKEVKEGAAVSDGAARLARTEGVQRCLAAEASCC
jgi:hypothetical protein